MIEKIYIKNFLSIKDAEIKLGKINLLIGPNNSGKSNFLKVFDFLKEKQHLDSSTLERFVYNHKTTGYKKGEEIIGIKIENENNDKFYKYVFINSENILETKIEDDTYALELGEENSLFEKIIDSAIIYNPNIEKIKGFRNLNPKDKIINSDCSNLVSFIDNMKDERPDILKNIEESLNESISNFKEIRTIKNTEESSKKILHLVDNNGISFTSNEVSEGTLYFLSILSIVHQPNPPQLLLLEEPEKNVHPKRIKEIINYLFKLSDEKNIQVILTTHSPIVVDEFSEMPENIHIFDFIEGKTLVRNLNDTINKENNNRSKNRYPILDFTKTTIGEHWVMGFLGGVPID